jgi:DNA polymerase-3 subunit gamma/tau
VALALYRKYRPRTFAEIIGQEHVTEPLSYALRSGRLNHAYLFSGPRGCGKTSSARILARSLNCEKGPTPEPCGECQSCRDLAPDGPGSIDVIEIDAASHGGVDDARDLRERAIFAPAASRFKVYVIDEAHMVSSAGFNALLKLVEEPPEYVKFVFATTEPEKVLGTIKSRTHHYPFRLIPPGVLRPYLEKLCETEGVKVEPAVFPLVVRAGGGSVRDSLSVLDQLIAGAGPDGVAYSRAVALLGVTDAALIDEMCDALAAGDGAAAYATVDRVSEAGHDPRRFASDLLERLRDLIVVQQVPDAAAKGLLDAPDDQLERMAGQASRIGPATLSRFADIVHNGLTEMRGTTAPRLLLELITARMLLPGADESSSALLQRLERMERRLGAAGEIPAPAAAPAAPAPAAVAPAAPPAVTPPVAAPSSAPAAGTSADAGAAAVATQTPSVVPEARRAAAPPQPAAAEPGPAAGPEAAVASAPGVLDAAAVRRVWDEILTTVRRQSQRAWAVVREATVREVERDTLVLVFKHTVHADMLTKSPDILTTSVTQVLGGSWQIRCEIGGATGGESRGGAAQRPANSPASPPAQVAGGATNHPAPSPRSARPAPAGHRSGDADGSGDSDGDDGWPTPARPGGNAPGATAPVVQPPAAAAASVPAAPAASVPAAPAASVAAVSASVAAVSAAPAEARPTPARPGGPGRADTVTGSGPAVTGPGQAVTGSGPAVAGPGHTVGSPGPALTRPSQAGVGPGQPAGPSFAAPAAQPAGMYQAAAPAAPARSAAAAAARAAAAGAAGRQASGSRAAGPQATMARPASPAPTGPGWSPASSVDEPPYDPDYDPPVSDPQYPGFDPGDEPTDEVIDERTARESSEEQALRLLAEALGAERIEERRP